MPALYETIQDFPAGVCIADVTIGKRDAVGVQTSAFTFKRTAQVFPGQVWTLSMSFLPMDREQAAVLETFILSLRGSAGRFRMGDPYQSLPRGRAMGSPVVAAGATAGAETVDVEGFTPNVMGQLEMNDRIQIGDHLYAVLESVNSDGSGNATLRVWPSLRESYTAGTAVITRNARGVFSLDSNSQQFTRNTVELYGTTLTATEAL